MANSVTARRKVDCFVGGRNAGVHNLTVVNDTVGDQTIFTPATDKIWGIVGIVCMPALDSVLTIKSGAKTIAVLNLAAKVGITKALENALLENGDLKGEALIFNASTPLGTISVKVLEYVEVNFHR